MTNGENMAMRSLSEKRGGHYENPRQIRFYSTSSPS